MGWLKAGGEGTGEGGAGGSLKGTRACWVTSWVTKDVSRILTTFWIVLAVTQLQGTAEGAARHLATPFTPSSGAPSLPGPVYVEGQQQPGYPMPNVPYLPPHLDLPPPHTLPPHQWDNASYHHHRYRLPHHHNHHHHYTHHNHHHHLHTWEIEDGGVEEEEEGIENGRSVDGEGIASRFSVSSSHHHHKHHRQKQLPPPSMRRRSSPSPGRGEAGGYAFRVDEKSGVRRVIAVREVAGRGGRAAGNGGTGGGIARLLDLPQDDSTVGPPPGPSFDRNLPRNITMQSGQTAVLSCRVFNVNDKSVSWIRQDNLHILTVDKYKYSTDQRVSVVFNEPNLEWVLRIKSVAPADAGTYECQVSTKPILSFVVNMKVVVPRAWILNAPEIYVHRGSPINLTCVVTHGTERPVFIYWYHHDQVIDYEGRDGVRVHTQNGRDTVSHLLVKKAGPGDTGRYTCSPSNGEPASVMLHVLNGEHQAAMQTNGATTTTLGADPRGALRHLLLLLALLHALPHPDTLHL